MTDKQVGIRIRVGVEGQDGAEKLSTQLDGLGREAAQAGTKAAAGAQGVQQLGQDAQGAAAGAAQAGKAVSDLGLEAAQAGTKAAVGAQAVRQLGQDSQGAATGAAQAGKAVSGMGAAAEQAGGNLTATRRGLESISKQLADTQQHINTLAQSLAAGFSFKQAVSAAADMERLQVGLQAVAKDSQLAAEQMAFISRMSQAAGVDVVAAGQAFLGLAAATKGTSVEGQATREVFEAVTLAMAKAGKSSDETKNALLALSQMASKGTVQMEELRGQLGEALPGALQATAKGLGITTQDLIKLVEAGGLAAEDLFPALTKGLNDLYGTAPAAQTLSQEIINIKNSFVEMSAALGDAGALVFLKKMAEAAQATFTLLGDTLIQTGQRIGVLVYAITHLDFSMLSASFKQIEDESRVRLLKAAEHNGVLTAALKLTSTEAIQTAIAAREAAAGHEQAGAAAVQHGTSLAKLGVEFAKAREELKQQLTLAEKEVEAVKARGLAAVAQASALNDEAAKRKAVAKAAADEATAVEALAKTKQAELKLLEDGLAARITLLAQGGKISDQRMKELEDLLALIKEKSIDVDKTTAQAAASREKARANSLEVQEAKALREHTEALTLARSTDAKVLLSGLQVQKDLARQAEELARYMGDEIGARKAHILQIEIEIKIIKARAEVARVEAEGSIAVAQAKRAELLASGQLTDLKKAEIDASIKLAQAKLAEAKATGGATELLERQLEALRNAPDSFGAAGIGVNDLARAQDGLATSTDRATTAQTGQTKAMEEYIKKYGSLMSVLEKNQYDKDKFALDSNGQRVSASDGTLDPLLAKMGQASAQAKFDGAMQAYQLAADKVQNYGKYFLVTGVTPATTEARKVALEGERQAAFDALQVAQQERDAAVAAAAAARTPAAGPATSAAGKATNATGLATSAVPVSATPSGAGQARTVNINIAGLTSTSVNVASDADAARLESMLRALATAAARSA